MKLNYSLAVILIPLALVSYLSSLPLSSALAQDKADVTTLIIDNQVMGKWARSCALCHVTGEANAPKMGDTENWNERLKKSEEEILQNVLYGYNSMPPLGYCMSCEMSDFKAMISFMAGREF
jgi:cytochrome c5